MAEQDERIDQLTASCSHWQQRFRDYAHFFLSTQGYTPSRADLEDVIGTAYLRAVRRLSRDKRLVVRNYRAWFTQFVLYSCRDFLQTGSKFVTNLEGEVLALAEMKGGDRTPLLDERLALKQAIASLSRQDQEIFRLRVQGYTAAEIADRNGLSPANVRKIVSRGYRKLRELLR